MRQLPVIDGEARCPLHSAGRCRSCPHMDLPGAAQLDRKDEQVRQTLRQGANPVPEHVWFPPVASATTRFRNKAKMAVSGSPGAPVLGLAGADGTSVDLRQCPLHVEAIAQALPVLAEHAARLGLTPYSITRRRGELKHVLVTASPDGDLMVRWVMRSRAHRDAIRQSLPRLRATLPTLAVASVNYQPVHQAIIEGAEEDVLTEESTMLMRLALPSLTAPTGAALPGRELALVLPVRSFFQTNTAVAEHLYATAAAWSQDVRPRSGSGPALVWDLFCGVGGFALALAGPGREVLGVEVSADAVRGARQAAALNGLDAQAVRFEAGDARLLDPSCGPSPDLLVVNPPRRGIGAELAARIEAAEVERVLYSSCNPRSLAADLAAMPSYTVSRAQVFDMFPHTDHAEVLVELRR